MKDFFAVFDFRKFCQLLIASLLISCVVAAVCALFASGLDFVMGVHYSWSSALLFIPVVLFVSLSSERFLPQLSLFLSSKTNSPSLSKIENVSDLLLLPLTWLSHLCGASVGRESVAVHLGRTLAQVVGDLLKLKDENSVREQLCRVGMAAGFAALFGTPWTALVFAFEWNSTPVDNMNSKFKLFQGLTFESFVLAAASGMSAFLLSSQVFALKHSHFSVPRHDVDLRWCLFLILLFVFSLGLARFYEKCKEIFAAIFLRLNSNFALRIAVPSILLFVVYFFHWAEPYKNLGLNLIQKSFDPSAEEPIESIDPLAKAVLTAFSLSAGFKGGEVTPLLAIGATAGHVVGTLLNVLPQAAAAAGFALFFALVFSVPLSGLVMSIELFGMQLGSSAASLFVLVFIRIYLRHKFAALSVSR